MTSHALLGRRRWRSQIRSGLYGRVVTLATIAVKRLLIGQNRRLVAALKLELRNLRQKFWLGFRARVTVSADIYCGRTRILFKQFSS